MPSHSYMMEQPRLEESSQHSNGTKADNHIAHIANTSAVDGACTATTLTNDDIGRYSRQLLLPQFGPPAQLRLKSSRVLIVGLGGLGTPAALYLTGAGVGTLGLVDRLDDAVHVSNLHRQILYTNSQVQTGQSKPALAAQLLKLHNPNVRFVTHDDVYALTQHNVTPLVEAYDVVLDCTDNVLTRYLLGDACASTRTPLVSGAAIGLSGQLSTLVSRPGSPCYRCIFPTPPPPNCVGSCDASGVLGPVPGVMGTLQALEALKLLAQFDGAEPLDSKLLLFDASSTSFRSVKVRPRNVNCLACGDRPTVHVPTYDYDTFINGPKDSPTAPKPPPNVDDAHRISVTQLAALRKQVQCSPSSTSTTAAVVNDNGEGDSSNNTNSPYTLIDVRPEAEFAISRLDEAHSHPLASLESAASLSALVEQINRCRPPHKTIIICRRGNASRRALHKLSTAGAQNVYDVVGGLEAWHDNVDPSYPLY